MNRFSCTYIETIKCNSLIFQQRRLPIKSLVYKSCIVSSYLLDDVLILAVKCIDFRKGRAETETRTNDTTKTVEPLIALEKEVVRRLVILPKPTRKMLRKEYLDEVEDVQVRREMNQIYCVEVVCELS